MYQVMRFIVSFSIAIIVMGFIMAGWRIEDQTVKTIVGWSFVGAVTCLLTYQFWSFPGWKKDKNGH